MAVLESNTVMSNAGLGAGDEACMIAVRELLGANDFGGARGLLEKELSERVKSKA